MVLEEKIEQYRQLKKSKKTLEKKLKELRHQILHEPQIEIERWGMTVQERNRSSYNEDRVWELMHQKAIHRDLFTREVIDPNKIEELYLCDKLTDSDLRYIREPNYSCALIEAGDVDVQKFDEGEC